MANHTTPQQQINILKELAPTNKQFLFYTIFQISTETDLEGLATTSRKTPKRENFSSVSLGQATTIYIYINLNLLFFAICFVLFLF